MNWQHNAKKNRFRRNRKGKTMPNTEDIFQLAQKAAVQVTASPDRWRRFLFTAAHNYRTTYLNQLLIHAQRPDATACAPMSYWNEQAHRKVMRGSKSIVVLQRREGKPVAKAVFSMSDTLLLGEKTAAPWEVTQENRKAVLQSLTDGDPRVFLIEQATQNAAEQFGRVRRVTERSVQGSALAWAKPDQQLAFMHDLAVQSAVYMAFLRLGLPVESANFPAFEQVAQLDTYPISLCLGGYLQTVAEPLLQEIGQAVLQQNRARDSVAKQAEPMHTISEPKENPDSRKEADRNDVHELQRISGAQPEPAEHAGSQAEPLRQDAAGISRTERADPLRPDDAGGHAAAELPQDGAGRAANGGQDPARADAENADAQPQDEPAGLGAAVQQPETAGGGSRPADAVRDLIESAPIAESEPSPSAFSLPEFPAELLPKLLKTETSSRAANADYIAFYQKSPLSIDRLRFVRDSYKDIFTELLLDGDTRVGFHRQEDGLLVWQGAYLTRSAETLLQWRAVANALNDLIGQHELTAALDVKALPQENTQLSFALPEDAPRGMGENLLADDELRSEEKQERAIPLAMENAPIRDNGSHITDEEVNLAVADGSGFEKGKLRIYRHFTEKRGDNAEFLKKEYGCGGRTWYYQNGGSGWVGHSPAGLTLTMTCADGRFERKLKWKETAQRIAYLLEMQRYLTPEEEKEYPVWLAQQQEKQPPRAVVVPEVKPVCAEGSVVYLENGQRFTVENIGKFDVHLRDENFPLISRAVSREQLQPLLDAEPRNGGMVLPEVPQIDRDSDQLKQALSYIADYLRNEFDITDADFSDLTQIDLGYTTTEDEQHTIQVCADLERCTISKLVDNTLYAQETFASLKAMNRDLLSSLEFDSLMEVDSNEIEEREPTESPFVAEVMADVERLSAAAEPAEYDLTNYLAPYEPNVPKGAKEKFAANVKAIQTLKAVEQRGTPATEAEQDILAGYLGWGGLSDAFDPGKDNWHTEYEQLKTLLTEDEYAAARESTLTAFYTPPAVIHAMYRALERIGCVGGNVLEPSMGVGAFFGHRHSKFDTHNAKLYGVELDSVSGRIAKQLYQKVRIQIAGYEKADLPDSFFDLAIGNVPFGQYQVSDRRYDKLHFQIHDYFLAKTVDKLRVGGVMAFITTSGTLDKKSEEVRRYLAARCDLIGAVRLPNTTFKTNAGTEVTSDILFLQKRGTVREQDVPWIHVGQTADGIPLNQYFIDHPEKICGEMQMVSGPYGQRATCAARENGLPLEVQLDAALADLQAEYSLEEPQDYAQEESGTLDADPNVRNFSYTVKDDVVYYRENSKMRVVQAGATALARIRALVPLRDTCRELIDAQLENY